MNVIERLEKQDLRLLAVDSGYNIILDEMKNGKEELEQLINLAKLGQAALEGTRRWFKSSICGGHYQSIQCSNYNTKMGCECETFCKLRKELTP
jgi:hypothetical protein